MAHTIPPFTAFKPSDVRQIFNESKRVLKTHAGVFLAAPHARNYGKVLIILPKMIGNAVVRNLTRRRIKGIITKHRCYEQPFDLIIIARTPITELSYQELDQLILTAYQRASRLFAL